MQGEGWRDSQEEFWLAKDHVLNPVQAKRDNVGGDNGNDNKFENFNAAPYPLEIFQRGRYEYECCEELLSVLEMQNSCAAESM